MKRRVWIGYTGGTIGMRRTARGWAPTPGFLESEMARMPQLHGAEMPEWELTEYEPLLDSAEMGPRHWMRIARDIAERHEDYDGFIIVHGTDTMAYTASALPFLLPGLAKPVVITGSQIPLARVRSDGHTNLIAAMEIAAYHRIPEVCLCFGSRIYRGCRATKIRANGLDAFHSPNFPALGTIGIDIDVRWELVRPLPPLGTRLTPSDIGEPNVGSLRVFPGITADLVHRVLAPPMQALVLETYGVGNAPTQPLGLLDAIEQAVNRGVVIVACSQCHFGRVDLDGYTSGADLRDAGVLSGHDMTVEAALAKLSWLLGQGDEPARVRSRVSEDHHGELTTPRRPPLELDASEPRTDPHDVDTWLSE